MSLCLVQTLLSSLWPARSFQPRHQNFKQSTLLLYMGGHRGSRAALLPSNLPALQNFIKRDPISYKDDFLVQWRHYLAMRDVFTLKPDDEGHEFGELIGFIAQVAPCYPVETKDFKEHLFGLLREYHALLHPDLRKTIVSSLVMMRNRDTITSVELLNTLFPLLISTQSKSLRAQLHQTIVADIKNANAKRKNHQLNRAIRELLFNIVKSTDDMERAAKQGGKNAILSIGGGQAVWAVKIGKELWKKNILNDADSVDVLRQACLHPNPKVMTGAVHFFLGSDKDDERDSSDEEEPPDVRKLQHQATINKKSKSRDRMIAKARVRARKMEKSKHTVSPLNFSALQLLHNPQAFAEQLFSNLTKFDRLYTLDHKLLLSNLISRLMGLHKLDLLSFHSHLIRYLSPHQKSVTQFLAYSANCVHDLVPPDVLEPVIRKIANEFVTGGVASEVVAAGINSIREISSRQPLAMTEDLLSDLSEYKSSRDKGVMMASRSLISLYRQIAPDLLQRKDRGKAASMGLKEHKALVFGESRDVVRGIEGIELLEAEKGNEEEDEADWAKWEVESDSSEDSVGWIDVSSDEDIQVSDDEDDAKTDATTNGTDPAEAATPGAESTVSVGTLATTKFLSPADLARLQELRMKNTAEKLVDGSKRKRGSSSKDKPTDEDIVTEAAIMGPRKKAKQDKEERLASIAAGREGREKFGASSARRKAIRDEHGGSSTNREKERQKNFLMIAHKKSVKGKKKRSLREKQIVLRRAADKRKGKK